MKNYFSLRALALALGLVGAVSRSDAADITVDTAVTGGLFEPHSVAVGPDGAAYITDGASHRVLRVLSGFSTYTVLAGETNVAGSNEGVGEGAHFNIPQGIVFARGGLIVADAQNHLIRFVSTSGVVTNLAGSAGLFGNVNGQGAAARFSYPRGLAADAAGNIYIADSQNNRIRKLEDDLCVRGTRTPAQCVGRAQHRLAEAFAHPRRQQRRIDFVQLARCLGTENRQQFGGSPRFGRA